MPSRKSKSRKPAPAAKEAGDRASRKIGELLRAKRIEKNFSQGELATMMGYESPQYISDWERAYSAVPLPKIVELSKILGLDRDRIFEMFIEFAKERIERELRAEIRKILGRRS